MPGKRDTVLTMGFTVRTNSATDLVVHAPGSASAAPGSWTRGWLGEQLGSTPGRYRLWSALLVVTALATAVVGFFFVDAQLHRAEDLRVRRGQAILDAQALRVSLLEADATAANAFLSNGAEPVELRDRYSAAVDRAVLRLTDVSNRTDTAVGRQAIERIAALLPEYVGSVESARANNRQGLPLGGAYLRSASELLRTQIIPEITTLESASLDSFKARYRGLGAGVFFLVPALLVLLLLELVSAQRLVRRKSRRRFNVPMLAASISCAIALLLLLVGLGSFRVKAQTATTDHLDAAVTTSDARSLAFQARADESLSLILRSNSAPFQSDFTTKVGAASRRLGDRNELGSVVLPSYADAVTTGVFDLQNSGQYGDAVAVALNTKEGSPTALFRQFDEASSQVVEASAASFRSSMSDAVGSIRRLRLLVPVLLLLSALFAAFGLQQRINEYR